jgi:uncharacterized protein
MILKLLLVIAVISVVYFIFFKKKPIQNQSKKSEKISSDMVECATCGIYSELDDSILSNGKYYCSQECLEAQK